MSASAYIVRRRRMAHNPPRRFARSLSWQPVHDQRTLAAAHSAAQVQKQSLGKPKNGLRTFSHILMGVSALGLTASFLYALYLKQAKISAAQKKRERHNAGQLGMWSAGIMLGGVALYGLSHLSFGVSVGAARTGTGGNVQPKSDPSASPGANLDAIGYFTAEELIKLTSIPGGPITQNGALIPHRFSFILSKSSIFRVNPDGTPSTTTLTLDELIEQSSIAKNVGQELSLVIYGDARAGWLRDLQKTLRDRGIQYRSRDDF